MAKFSVLIYFVPDHPIAPKLEIHTLCTQAHPQFQFRPNLFSNNNPHLFFLKWTKFFFHGNLRICKIPSFVVDDCYIHLHFEIHANSANGFQLKGLKMNSLLAQLHWLVKTNNYWFFTVLFLFASMDSKVLISQSYRVNTNGDSKVKLS